uniref:Tektin like 1 n=1 Tax=Astyanax mexicanus TaxID=7994 RepID=W5K143_ASTMX
MKKGVFSAPAAPVSVGDQKWRDRSLSSIQRAQRLVLQTHMDALQSPARYRRAPLSSRLSNSIRLETLDPIRPKSTGTTLYSLGVGGPFPSPALRDQSAEVSISLAGKYMRGVREVEGWLRREAGKVTQEATKLQHQRERLEKLLWSFRKALLVNQQSTDGRKCRPATTETGRDGADLLLSHERKGLNKLKQKMDIILKDTLTQEQALAHCSRQLLDCALERSSVIELLPQLGSPSKNVHTSSSSPLSMKPDSAGPYTPECKEVLESSAAELQKSQQLRESIKQLMCDAIIKQKNLHYSANEGLLKKIAETVNLQHHLTLSSAATKQAINRKQRQMQSASYSHGRVLGPVSSEDLFCREKLDRPVMQVYGRHQSWLLPESNLLTQGNVTLKQHLESAEKAVEELQVARLHLDEDTYLKRAAASVDSSVVRLRRRLVRPKILQVTNT